MRNLITTDSHLSPPPWMVMELPEQMRDKAFTGFLSNGYEERGGKRYLKMGPVAGVMGGAPTNGHSVPAEIEFESEQDLVEQLYELSEDRPGSVGAHNAFTPELRLLDMQRENVVGAVLLGDAYIYFERGPDHVEAQLTWCRIMNDWLAETYKAHLDKFAPGIYLPWLDPAACAPELERAAAMGLRNGFLPDGIWDDPYANPHWERLWEAAAGLKVPLSFHTGGTSMTAHEGRHLGSPLLALQSAITDLVYSGMLQKYPDLRVVMTEGGISWLAPMMQDSHGKHQNRAITKTMSFVARGGQLAELAESPSFYIKRQVSATFMWDPVGVNNRRFTGVDCLMWGNDYPHPEGTFPHSQDLVDELFEDVSEEETDKMVYRNAKELFGFTV